MSNETLSLLYALLMKQQLSIGANLADIKAVLKAREELEEAMEAANG